MNASILFSRPEISIISSSAPTSTILPRKISTNSRISLRWPPGGALHFEQHQVAFDVVPRADVDDSDHGHDLFQLLAHLLQDPIVAHDHEGHAREIGVFRLTHGQGVDVVPA